MVGYPIKTGYYSYRKKFFFCEIYSDIHWDIRFKMADLTATANGDKAVQNKTSKKTFAEKAITHF
jgi:hypothetical protein